MVKNCAYCGELFIPTYGHQYQKYCLGCGRKAYHKRRRERRTIKERESREKIVCRKCGELFTPTKENHVYCSDKCRPYERHLSLMKCAICGIEFMQTGARQKVCKSKYCYKRRANIYSRNRNMNSNLHRASPSVFKCIECGEIVPTEYGDKRREFCSDKCNKKYNGRIGKATRRIHIRIAKYIEHFHPFHIFNRDKWHCQLCGVKTPKRLRGTYDNDAPELDHIIPVSLGGEHTVANTQCLCRRCNQIKGATIVGQLRFA